MLKKHGFIGSMSRKGNCWDNAVAESFFGSLKQERVQWRHYQTRHEAQQDVLQYIAMFYNQHRLHSYLGYKSPGQYEVERLDACYFRLILYWNLLSVLQVHFILEKTKGRLYFCLRGKLLHYFKACLKSAWLT